MRILFLVVLVHPPSPALMYYATVGIKFCTTKQPPASSVFCRLRERRCDCMHTYLHINVLLTAANAPNEEEVHLLRC